MPQKIDETPRRPGAKNLLALLLTAGCALSPAPLLAVGPEAPPATLAEPEQPVTEAAAPSHNPYADRPDVLAFVDQMVQKHGFEREALLALFRQARQEPAVLAAIQPRPRSGAASWRNYRKRFLDRRHIQEGKRYWQAHAVALNDASARFGPPPEIMVAIIGIETHYGRAQGRFQTFSALTTLAFDYPPRAELFRRELAELLLLARENGRDPLSYKGSYAGALGQPQFLPSSLRHYAVDGDGDGRIDLAGSPADAISSVGSFLAQHGWQKGGRIALPLVVKGKPDPSLADGNVEARFSASDFKAHGIAARLRQDEKAALIDLATPGKPTEYWLGLQNFYVITRYNKSSAYAMSVFQLAQQLKQGQGTHPRKKPRT